MWKGIAGFYSQSCGVVSAKLITFRHSNENHSIDGVRKIHLTSPQAIENLYNAGDLQVI